MGGASGDVAIFFERLSMKDVASVGGKNASLGEMYRQLRPLGVRVPNGFAVHIDAFRASLSRKDLDALHAVLDPLDKSDSDFVHKLAIAGQKCRDIVYKAELTPEHTERILEAYRKLTAEYEDSSGLGVSVAVRSSATAEDLPSASFAGQHDTYLNIRGEAQLIQAIKRCNASLFTDRAISYRMDQGFDHFKVFLSTGVMKMVRSDLASSGVMFSIDTETGFKDAVFITASVGLGENVVLGNVDPDEFFVHKPTFRKGARAVLRRRLGRKQVKMVFSLGTTREPVRNTPTPVNERESYCLTDEQVMELADCAIKIEDHYSAINGHLSPMDIEWALDGVDHKLYIVQARPETVASQKSLVKIEQYDIKPSGFEVITTGRAVGTKVSTGTVRVIHSTEELQRFTKGEILVSDTTTPDWEPIMKMASGIITARGGRTCHASIVARELGITAVVGAEDALHKLKTGDSITISCAEGDVGTSCNSRSLRMNVLTVG
ncbi:pyruvate, water dikinase [Plasmodiophora brassicae]